MISKYYAIVVEAWDTRRASALQAHARVHHIVFAATSLVLHKHAVQEGQPVGAVPACAYFSVQVAATAGGKEPLLELRIGDITFCAPLDTESSVSLAGNAATGAAVARRATVRQEQHCLCLATGVSDSKFGNVSSALGRGLIEASISSHARSLPGHGARQGLPQHYWNLSTCIFEC